MTRINLVHPSELCDQHLMAEFREITRIPNLINSGKFSFRGKPDEYCLGDGHVKFFYDKLTFLHKRYAALYVELRYIRLFDVQYIYAFSDVYRNEYFCYWYDYIPTTKSIELNQSRIIERMPSNARFTNRNAPLWCVK